VNGIIKTMMRGRDSLKMRNKYRNYEKAFSEKRTKYKKRTRTLFTSKSST